MVNVPLRSPVRARPVTSLKGRSLTGSPPAEPAAAGTSAQIVQQVTGSVNSGYGAGTSLITTSLGNGLVCVRRLGHDQHEPVPH